MVLMFDIRPIIIPCQFSAPNHDINQKTRTTYDLETIIQSKTKIVFSRVATYVQFEGI